MAVNGKINGMGSNVLGIRFHCNFTAESGGWDFTTENTGYRRMGTNSEEAKTRNLGIHGKGG
jgi:hypothetical protein